jgi:hypothetical protein
VYEQTMPGVYQKKEVLAERLRAMGESVPEKMTRLEILGRLTELGGTTGRTTTASAEQKGTSLNMKMAQLKRASRLKEDLVQFCRNDLAMDITGAETIPTLHGRGVTQAYRMTDAHPLDQVGFGRHADLSYETIGLQEPKYLEWAAAEMSKGGCDPRMTRLVEWYQQATEYLQNKKNKVQQFEIHTPVKAPAKEQAKVPPRRPAQPGTGVQSSKGPGSLSSASDGSFIAIPVPTEEETPYPMGDTMPIVDEIAQTEARLRDLRRLAGEGKTRKT